MKIFIAIEYLFSILAFIFIVPLGTQAFASSIVFQDNFDDDNADGWTVTRNPCKYNGASAPWTIKDKKLGIKINGGSCVTEIMPSDSIWNYAGNDYSMEFDMTLVSGTDHNFAFRYTDPNQWYDIHIQAPNTLVLQRVYNTSIYNNTTTGNFSNGQTIHFRIDIVGEHIKIYLGNVPQLILDYQDAGGRFRTGRIALQASAGGDPNSETYFDNIVVTSIDSDLNVPNLKQTSDPWQSQEYDSASLWSPENTTINRWGCALTSAAMILQYHGITKLIDGTGLDPGSLNTWLISQTDGYVGTGWINWLAISRLSKLAKTINNITAFDALEYTRVNSADKTQLTTDLKSSRPDILEEPGHFVVAKGISGNTFNINDPFYDRSDLNDGYSNTFLSLGRYVPSLTNLSYLMFTLDPSVEMIITNPTGQKTGNNGTTNYNEISGASYYTQNSLVNHVTNQTNSPIKIFMIPKPSDGTYTISVATTSSTPKGFSLKIYEYITDGTPTVNTFSGYSRSDEQAKFSLNYKQSPNGNQETPQDLTPPQMKSAKTLDKDKDGKLDAIRIEFVRDINRSSVNSTGTDFQVNGYTVTSADDVNDGVIEIIIAEKNSNDTGQTPTVILKGDGNGTNKLGVKDKLSNKWNNQQTITPTDGASPTKPTINVDGGDYISSQSATLTSSDSPNSPTIYYTLDGTDPTNSSSRTIYSDPITINDDLTLKAIAVDTAGNLSEVLTKTYGIAPTIHKNTVTATASASSFTVVWTTNRPSHSRVVFGTTSKKVLGSGEKYGYDKTTTEDTTRVTNHSVTITDLKPGQTYYYRVISKGSPEQIGDEQSVTIPAETTSNASSESSSSSSSSSPSSSSSSSSSLSSSSSPPVCNDQKPDSAPTLISAFPGINTVTLTWSAAKDPVSYYLIAYGTESGKPLYGNPNIGGKGTTSFVVENLSGGVTYYFKVRAGNGCTPGNYSNEIAATPIGFAQEGLGSGFKENVLGASNKRFVTSKQAEVKPTASEVLSFRTKTKNEQKDIKLEFILIFFGFVSIASAVYLAKTFLKKP